MLKPNALPLQVSLWWMPLVWATRIVDQARAEGKIASDPAVQTLLGEISKIRIGLTRVQHYDMISVPLVYTQARFCPKKCNRITYVILIFCQLIIINEKTGSKDIPFKSKTEVSLFRFAPWLFTFTSWQLLWVHNGCLQNTQKTSKQCTREYQLSRKKTH